MKKYSVMFIVHASTIVEVEAENEKEARAKAEQNVYEPSLCHQCSDNIEVCGIGDICEVTELESKA